MAEKELKSSCLITRRRRVRHRDKIFSYVGLLTLYLLIHLVFSSSKTNETKIIDGGKSTTKHFQAEMTTTTTTVLQTTMTTTFPVNSKEVNNNNYFLRFI